MRFGFSLVPLQYKGVQLTDGKIVGMVLCGRRCAEATAQVVQKHASGDSLYEASVTMILHYGSLYTIGGLLSWLIYWGDSIEIFFFSLRNIYFYLSGMGYTYIMIGF